MSRGRLQMVIIAKGLQAGLPMGFIQIPAFWSSDGRESGQSPQPVGSSFQTAAALPQSEVNQAFSENRDSVSEFCLALLRRGQSSHHR